MSAGLNQHILSRWQDTLRPACTDSDTLIGLPHPYTVPCAEGTFQEMYYWDTYYSNAGLLAHGQVEQAKNNTLNLLHLCDRFGFVPNGNRTWFLKRSQPPHLALMVRDVFAATSDLNFLARALPSLETELRFWNDKRSSAIGLASYNYGDSPGDFLRYRGVSNPRRHVAVPATESEEAVIQRVGNDHAECESGWDHSSRWEGRTIQLCPADLNALLFFSESFLSESFDTLQQPQRAEAFRIQARSRAGQMMRYLYNPDIGVFQDYDVERGHRLNRLHAGSFYPLWLGLTPPGAQQGFDLLLRTLERPHGIVACDPPSIPDFLGQWDAPNAWAPLSFAALRAAEALGRGNDAARIRETYLNTHSRLFAETGLLWEKINAETGKTDTSDEYPMPAMMGWTAGVFACFYQESQ